MVSAERRPKAAHPLAETSGRRGAITHAVRLLRYARKPKPTSRVRDGQSGRGPARAAPRAPRSLAAAARRAPPGERGSFRWKLERPAVRCVEALDLQHDLQAQLLYHFPI
mgnify:CR=1 FL=1